MDIADIQYMPDIYLRPPEAAGDPAREPVPLLTILMNSGERIRVEGKPAALAWASFQQACGIDPPAS